MAAPNDYGGFGYCEGVAVYVDGLPWGCYGGGGGGGDWGGGFGGGGWDSPGVPDEGNGFLPNIPKGKARADLAKKDCFGLLGFAAAEAAQQWFDKSITFYYGSYGKLNLKNGVPTTLPAPANTMGYGQININIDYNWDDFTKVATQQGGTFNYLSYINKGLGTNMTSEQLGELIILHELGHQATAPKQPSDAESAAEMMKIYNRCVK